MATWVRRGLALAALLTTSLTLAITGTATANAGQTPQPPPGGSVNTSGGAVTVSGTGYRPGSAGSPGSPGGGGHVFEPATCWMQPSRTGKDFYDYIKGGQYVMVTEEAWLGTYELYKDDDKGHWYTKECDIANFPDPSDEAGFLKFSYQFGVDHPTVYVQANETPPATRVPPARLREIAINSLTPPEPELDWNPKRTGNQGTLVNLDTWFWLNNAPRTLDVQATALGDTATVTATFDGMEISAPGESPVPCDGPGTAYAVGAHTNCKLAFSRASSALGAQATPVTVKTRWTGTWAFNGGVQRPIPNLYPDATSVDIRVDEVQTLVTGAR